jgi:hypothetical protein
VSCSVADAQLEPRARISPGLRGGWSLAETAGIAAFCANPEMIRRGQSSNTIAHFTPHVPVLCWLGVRDRAQTARIEAGSVFLPGERLGSTNFARQLPASRQTDQIGAFSGAWSCFQCDDWISRNLHVPYLIVSASALIATRQRVMAIPILSGLRHHYVGYNFRKKQVSQKRQEPSALGPFIGKPDRISW